MTSGAAQAPARSRSRKARETDVKVWNIGFPHPDRDGEERAFVQKGLSFFESNEFTALLSTSLGDALDTGFSVQDIVEQFMKQIKTGGFDMDDLKSLLANEEGDSTEEERAKIIDLLIRTVVRFVSAAPRLLEDTYLLALGVEPELRSRVRPYLRKIDHDTGFGILDAFIDQNRKTLADFFARWWKAGTKLTSLASASVSAEPAAS